MSRLQFRLNRLLAVFITGTLCLIFVRSTSASNEVFKESSTRVVMREHPKTGKPFVSIVPSDSHLAAGVREKPRAVSRPDYRMLDPQVNAKDVPYDGPVSDRRKVYIFAGTLAALGAGAGVYGAIAPAAASGTSGVAGGAGLYAGGAALTGGGPLVASIAAQGESQPEDFKMTSESKENPSE